MQDATNTEARVKFITLMPIFKKGMDSNQCTKKYST